jgi:hypothetical protein
MHRGRVLPLERFGKHIGGGMVASPCFVRANAERSVLGWQKTVAAGRAFFTGCGKCPSLSREATAPHNCRLVVDLGYVDRNASGGSGILPGLF